MRIRSNLSYRVRRFSTGKMAKRYPDCDYGSLPGSDVRSILKGCKYDPEMDMWFTKSSQIGYSVEVLK